MIPTVANAIWRIRFRRALDGLAISMVGQLDGKILDRDHICEPQSERQPKQIVEAIIRQRLTARAQRLPNPKKCPFVGRLNPTAGRPEGASAFGLCPMRTVKFDVRGTENVSSFVGVLQAIRGAARTRGG
jgi:hypothetical protein